MENDDAKLSCGRNLPTLMGQLRALHDSEINWQISCFFDGQWAWKLGDEMNGFSHTGSEFSMEDAVRALVAAACRRFPESQFASRYAEAVAA